MANARTLALLTVVLLGVSVASLDAKKLLETSAQAEANILGSQLWCGVCRYIASLNAKQLHRAASQVLTLGEALMLSCQTTGGRTQEACERILSRISEGMGYSFATTGEFVIPACRVNPFCNRVNFDESEFEDNTVFDFVCGRCKSLARSVLGTTDLVVSDQNLRTVFTPFCQAVRFIGRSPKGCITAITQRFKDIYGSSTAILKPANVCQLYGLCALATPPSPKKAPEPAPAPAPKPAQFYTT